MNRRLRRAFALGLFPALLALAPVTTAGATTGAAHRTTAHTKARAARTYALGITTQTFVDRSRPTKANGAYTGAPSRTLVTTILYPAEGRAGGREREGAKPARHGGPFPLLVFSHGFTARAPDYLFLLRRIADRGYVVAAPTFPLSNRDAPGGPNLTDVANQPGDVSFVITQMLRLDRGHGPLRHLVDGKRIGAAGHSLGAITTLLLVDNRCCHDARVKAAIPMSGLQLSISGTPFDWPSVPLLLIHGNQDKTVPYNGSVDSYRAARAPKFFVTLEGAPHSPFGSPWIDPLVRSMNDFLDRYLRSDRHGLTALARDGNVAGVATLQATPR